MSPAGLERRFMGVLLVDRTARRRVWAGGPMVSSTAIAMIIQLDANQLRKSPSTIAPNLRYARGPEDTFVAAGDTEGGSAGDHAPERILAVSPELPRPRSC